MALGDASSPNRFLYGQSGTDDRNLSLKVFGGEVLAAFDLQVQFKQRVTNKSLPKGAKSWQFPKTWKATSEYHVPGTELLGTDIDTTEVTITADDILVSHFSISDLDDMLTHFEVRSEFANAAGYELAKVLDKNLARQIILTAREAADGPFPAGNVITDATLTDTGVTNGEAWINHIREANRNLFGKDVPEYLPRYFAANENVFDAIKWATDTNGNYLMLNRDFGNMAGGGIQGRSETLMVDGVTVIKSRNIPDTNESADTSVYSKYRGNFSTTTGIMWVPAAVGLCTIMDIGFETTRDTRRLEDFTVAKMFCGAGTLRPEGAVEFKTS